MNRTVSVRRMGFPKTTSYTMMTVLHSGNAIAEMRFPPQRLVVVVVTIGVVAKDRADGSWGPLWAENMRVMMASIGPKIGRAAG